MVVDTHVLVVTRDGIEYHEEHSVVVLVVGTGEFLLGMVVLVVGNGASLEQVDPNHIVDHVLQELLLDIRLVEHRCDHYENTQYESRSPDHCVHRIVVRCEDHTVDHAEDRKDRYDSYYRCYCVSL